MGRLFYGSGIVFGKIELISYEAFLSACRSKDPFTQVGACIVNQEKKIVGIGYNG